MIINRFPKMAVLQKYRALKLWYPENLAKAIWIAEATKYAIFKNLALSKRENIEKKLVSTGKVKSYEELQKLKFDDVFKIHFKDWRPFVWWKIFKDTDYDRYFSRFTDEINERLENWAKDIIENVNDEILKNEQKFFKEVWVKVRDNEI
jgi:hypothetical protein